MKVEPAAEIHWIDGGYEPTQKPDPRYPDGIDLDCSDGAAKTCMIRLPYPAKRCGYWAICCNYCGYTALVTTAGRIDDPRSLRMPCKNKGDVH